MNEPDRKTEKLVTQLYLNQEAAKVTEQTAAQVVAQGTYPREAQQKATQEAPNALEEPRDHPTSLSGLDTVKATTEAPNQTPARNSASRVIKASSPTPRLFMGESHYHGGARTSPLMVPAQDTLDLTDMKQCEEDMFLGNLALAAARDDLGSRSHLESTECVQDIGGRDRERDHDSIGSTKEFTEVTMSPKVPILEDGKPPYENDVSLQRKKKSCKGESKLLVRNVSWMTSAFGLLKISAHTAWWYTQPVSDPSSHLVWRMGGKELTVGDFIVIAASGIIGGLASVVGLLVKSLSGAIYGLFNTFGRGFSQLVGF